MTSRLWLLGQSQITKLVDGLTEEQLRKGLEVAEMLFNNLNKER
jgi:hypothetical protein